MKNSKQHLTDAFSSLQDAQINLRHALDNSEKLNNTERIKSTLSLVNECQFDNAFTFIYSPRENTPAAKLEDNVSLEEKENRLHRLNEVVNKYFLENNKKLVDTIVPVLVEGKNTNGKDGLYGYTDTNKLINFDGDESLTGKIVSIQVTSAKTWSLDGKLAE